MFSETKGIHAIYYKRIFIFEMTARYLEEVEQCLWLCLLVSLVHEILFTYICDYMYVLAMF